MRYSKEKLEELKNNTSILDYGANVYGFTPIRIRSNYWGFKPLGNGQLDSLVVNPNRNCFFRNSEFVAGEKSSQHNNSAGGIIDFILHFDKCSVGEAIKKLFEYNNSNYKQSIKIKKYECKKIVFKPPVRYKYSFDVYDYLCDVRKISRGVVSFCIKHNYLYEEKGYYKNAVFCGYNDGGKMIFAQRCSTRLDISNDKRKRDVGGSSYEECFYIDNGASSLIVTEAIIDTLSFMTILEQRGKRYKNYNHLATTGTNKIGCIYNILNKYPNITKLYLAFDNDEAGKKAYNNVINQLKAMGWIGNVFDFSPHSVKDINDVVIKGEPEFLIRVNKI